MGDSHSVLGEGSGLIRADGGGGSEGLDSFQVLDEAVLAGHSLGSEGQAHGNSGDETFRHVGDNDADQEYDGSEPMVSEDEGDDEEGNSKEDGDSSNQVDEVLDFASDGSHSSVQSGGQVGNTTHNSSVSGVDDDSLGSSFDGVGGEEGDVFGFQRVLVGAFGRTRLRLRLSGERRVIDLESEGRDDTEVSRDTISSLDLDDISNDQFLCADLLLLTITIDKSILKTLTIKEKR